MCVCVCEGFNNITETGLSNLKLENSHTIIRSLLCLFYFVNHKYNCFVL